MTQNTHAMLRSFVEAMPLGQPFAVQVLQEYGSRHAVDKALSRLTKEGLIQRAARGVYVRPEKNPILGDITVSLEEIALLIAKNENARIQMSGESALLALRLSTQVPVKPIYYTDGRNRIIRRQNALLRLRHVSPKIMVCAGTEASLVLSALYVLGKDAVTPALLQHIRAVLPPNALTALWQKRTQMIGWMRACVERLVLMEATS